VTTSQQGKKKAAPEDSFLSAPDTRTSPDVGSAPKRFLRTSSGRFKSPRYPLPFYGAAERTVGRKRSALRSLSYGHTAKTHATQGVRFAFPNLAVRFALKAGNAISPFCFLRSAKVHRSVALLPPTARRRGFGTTPSQPKPVVRLPPRVSGSDLARTPGRTDSSVWLPAPPARCCSGRNHASPDRLSSTVRSVSARGLRFYPRPVLSPSWSLTLLWSLPLVCSKPWALSIAGALLNHLFRWLGLPHAA